MRHKNLAHVRPPAGTGAPKSPADPCGGVPNSVLVTSEVSCVYPTRYSCVVSVSCVVTRRTLAPCVVTRHRHELVSVSSLVSVCVVSAVATNSLVKYRSHSSARHTRKCEA